MAIIIINLLSKSKRRLINSSPVQLLPVPLVAYSSAQYQYLPNRIKIIVYIYITFYKSVLIFKIGKFNWRINETLKHKLHLLFLVLFLF